MKMKFFCPNKTTPRLPRLLSRLLRRISLAAAILFAPALFGSCNYGLPIFLFTETGVETRAQKAYTLYGDNLPQVGNKGIYSFVVLTDSHFGSGRDRNEEGFLRCFEDGCWSIVNNAFLLFDLDWSLILYFWYNLCRL